MRSDSTILLSGWSASRVSRRAKAGTNKNARHSPDLTTPPFVDLSTRLHLLYPRSFRIFFPSFPFLTSSFCSFCRGPPPRLRSAGTFLVLSRSPSKTNQIFGEVLTQPSQRRRWPPDALNVTVSSHAKNGKARRRFKLETLLYQFPTVAMRSNAVLVFSFFDSIYVRFFCKQEWEISKIESIHR